MHCQELTSPAVGIKIFTSQQQHTCAIQSPTEYTTPLITILAKTGLALRASS